MSNDALAAKQVIADVVRQKEAPNLVADDLIWVAERPGPIRSAGWVGEAIATWIYHHGPIHPELLRTAEELAKGDNSAYLDEVLLWVEPTPDRWIQYGVWVRMHIDWVMVAELKKAGKTMPDRLTAPDDITLYKSLVANHRSRRARLGGARGSGTQQPRGGGPRDHDGALGQVRAGGVGRWPWTDRSRGDRLFLIWVPNGELYVMTIGRSPCRSSS